MAAEWADIDAIRDYLNVREGQLRAIPGGGKLLDDFRRWYVSLGIIDQTLRVRERVSEAKWYRDRANTLLGKKPLDPSTYPSSDAPPASSDPTPHPPLVPTWAKVGLVAGGVLLAWSLLSSASKDD